VAQVSDWLGWFEGLFSADNRCRRDQIEFDLVGGFKILSFLMKTKQDETLIR
jgi:hypothetical protein